MEQPNYYAIIPSNVRYDKDLKPNEKLLYGEITSLSNRLGICYASNKYFAELYDVAIETVSRWIKHLKDLGYIQVEITYKDETKEIDKRLIRIIGHITKTMGKTVDVSNEDIVDESIDDNDNTTMTEISRPYQQKSQDPLDEKVKENNTSINNFSSSSYKNKASKKNMNIFDYVEQNFGRPLTPIEFEEINKWVEVFDSNILLYAIEIAVLNNKKTFGYVAGILRNWKSLGYKTLPEIREHNGEYNLKKERDTKPPIELFDYNWLDGDE